MGEQDIFSSSMKSGRSGFRYRPNRNEELTIQNELEQLEKKSLKEISASRELRKQQVFADEYRVTRQLAPHFKHERIPEKRRLEPMFPADPPLRTLSQDLLKVSSKAPPNSPNTVQVAPPTKGPNGQLVRTKKYPYCKPEAIRIKDLTKTHRTTVGVLPLNRDSMEISDLKVIMEGKHVNAAMDVLDNISLANRCESQTLSVTPEPSAIPPAIPDNVPPVDHTPQEPPEPSDQSVSAILGQSKPAILGKTGTTQPITFSQRQKPPPKPKTKLKPRKMLEVDRSRSAKSIQSSLMSGEMILPGHTTFSQYDEALDELQSNLENVVTAVGSVQPSSGGPSGPSSAHTSRPGSSSSYKSSKALLEEARRLASPQAVKSLEQKYMGRPGRDLRSKSDRSALSREVKKSDKGRAKSLMSSRDDDTVTVSSQPRSERTVDEIISSLRIQSRTGERSEADLRIQEIMDQVLSRTSVTLGDASEAGSTSDVQGGTEAVKPEEEMDAECVETGESLPDAEASTAICTELDLDPSTLPDVPPPLTGSQSDRSASILDSQQDMEVTIQQAWEDLLLPPEATYEDVVNVEGEAVDLEERRVGQQETGEVIPVQSTAVSFLSTWAPGEEKPKLEVAQRVFPEKTIHHFCTSTTACQLPKSLQGIGRKYHTPSKYGTPFHPYRFNARPQSLQDSSGVGGDTVSEATDGGLSRRQSLAAAHILEEAGKITEDGQTLEMWAEKAEQMLSVEGSSMPLRTDESRLYWTPAPPRLDVPPAKVKEMLFPQYEGRVAAEDFEAGDQAEDSSDDSEEEELFDPFYMDPEDREHRERILARRYQSNEDLTRLMIASREREEAAQTGSQKSKEEAPEDGSRMSERGGSGGAEKTQDSRETTLSDSDRSKGASWSRQLTEEGLKVPGADDILPVFVPLRKTKSVTVLIDETDETLIIPNDFSEAMDEIQKMRVKISEVKFGKKPAEKAKVVKSEPETEYAVDEFDYIFTTQVEEVDQTQLVHTDTAKSEKSQRKKKPTPAEQALAAGRSYVILPKKKKKRKSVDTGRIEAVQRFLSTSPVRISRTSSLPRLHRTIDRELRVPISVRSQRRGSLPAELDFKQFAAQKGKLSESDLREWVRDLWNVWFDQVFPPTPEGSDKEEEEGDYIYPTDLPDMGLDDTGYKGNQRRISLAEIESVDCLDDTEENEEIRDILLEEVTRLTQEIESSDKPVAFDIGRRGAIYRKLGKLKKATADINRAIQMEPLLLDAYWHRHLISLVLGKKQAALDDLTFILKHNKRHAGAYRSMAEIFRDQGEITMAIVNYTQAIKLNPEDHDAYSRRAEMYEKRGEMRLALEDYSQATKLQPTKTDAIFKHGMYFFQNESWNNAINDFNDLLKVEPTNSVARMFRGRAYASLGQYNAAVADLSGAIHMDPNNWLAFYHRGCLLRRAHPQRALLDFSMSLLVNDTEENLMAYFHRGILYNSMDRPQDAIPDFEALLKLDSNVPSAHINLGLIYMTKYQDYHRGIKKFSAAVKVDPTCVRAIVCRGECYHKLHDIRNALKDFTRAIHLAPDVHHYYMYRGQLVLELGNLDLAAFCVRHASELGADSSLGQSSTQQAVVQTFLRNYDKAVDVLTAETRVTPGAPLFMLLGKTQIKAKSYKDAIESFQRALALYKPWSQWEPWPLESAEAHFLVGMCQVELRNYNGALDAFNSAIKINSHHAESFYQRGLTKIRLKQSKGIQDFNRALALDPTLYQVFLSRACYYGMKGKYAKAILNCNEALKLQPHSVRSYLYRGALKFHIKAYELAIRDLTIATSLDNTCSLAFFNRAVCYQHFKLYDKALTDYGIVLLLGDDLSIKVLINRGLLYFEKGDYVNALFDFKMAAKLHPWDHNIHHSLGLCYHKLNRLQESVVAFTKSLTEKPSFLEALVARGNVYMDYGHEEGRTQARVDYQRVLLYNPNFFSARVNLAYSLQVRGQFMQAWRQFTAAIDVNPNYSPALEGRSVVNLQMSDLFAAIQDINAAISVNPTAELLTNRGVIHQFMKDGVNAMKDYHLAMKKDPTYALAYFNAANVHFHTRHFKQALDHYNKAIRYNPKDESAYLNRAITKVLLQDTPGALEDFKLAIKLSPHSAHIYFNRGNLHASMAKFDKAELDYNKALLLKPDDPLVLKRRADVRGKLGRREEAIEDYRRAISVQSQITR